MKAEQARVVKDTKANANALAKVEAGRVRAASATRLARSEAVTAQRRKIVAHAKQQHSTIFFHASKFVEAKGFLTLDEAMTEVSIGEFLRPYALQRRQSSRAHWIRQAVSP